jgi:hypothetical protein
MTIRRICSWMAGCGIALCLALSARAAWNPPVPAWWVSRGVLVPGAAVTNDHAAVNQGEVKWIASNACAELEAMLPDGAGTGVWAQANGFSASNNYRCVNVGQLKALAQPFYDRLIEFGYTNAYPWTAATNDDADHAIANIGQVKNLFSFSLDSDGDGLPDWWEWEHFGTLAQSGTDDSDRDGISNSDEWQGETDPNFLVDSDEDGLSDYEESQLGTDPLNPADGRALLEEARQRVIRHWRMLYRTPLEFTNPPGSAEDLADLNAALSALSGKFMKPVSE